MIYPRLEKYRGPASRYKCPNCGKRGEFTRYIREDDSYIADDVGRCNRASCGYHFTPRKYFAENPDLRTDRAKGHVRVSSGRTSGRSETVSDSARESRIVVPDYLDPEHLASTIGGYQHNSFVQFLFDLFPNDAEDVAVAIREYRIGTKDGFTVFPVIDRWQRFCKAQMIRYDRITGSRIRDKYSISSIQNRLKAKHLIDRNFETDKNVYFGEHLLTEYPGRRVAIVEAPKTAVISSICRDVFPNFVWLACLGKDNLNADRLERLGRERTFHLFPDTKGYEKWLEIASVARKRGLTVFVSDSIQKFASETEKRDDFDLADYLIREQAKRNDPSIREAFRDLIEERLAIMTIHGGMEEEVAESMILRSGFYNETIGKVLPIWEQTLERNRYEG